ncbi:MULTISPECIES: S-layer protein [Nostocales]|uniref:S-layer protein n=3 Tax=Nostocales TaxID=1161 RepID=A0A0C1N886_9CYAN|nr:S-layer protein [Tolypothrix bouteillei]KAF3886881.1 S-layer protein [Tolypothrix bouteillei VB521301]
MNFFKVVAASILVLNTTYFTALVNAQDSPVTPPTHGSQVPDACVRNQAETLPIPFSDVSPDHWAFKAVMTMYYCGAFRQATPPSLRQQPQSSEKEQLPQKDSRLQTEQS